MTQQLADKLIAHYESAILEVISLEVVRDIKIFLLGKGLTNGICHCANVAFEENLYEDEWVLSLSHSVKDFWFERPYHLETKEAILQSLQFRVDRLKTFK